MADLGAVGTLPLQTKVYPMDSAAAQDVSISPVGGVFQGVAPTLPYRKNWKTVSGYVYGSSGGEADPVAVFDSSSKSLLNVGVASAVDGSFSIPVPYVTPVFVIRFNPPSNAQIFDAITPV